MHLDVIADHELHARQPDPVGRKPPPAERRRRIGHVQHHLRAGLRQVGNIELGALDLGRSLVDEALVAFGAGHGDVLPVVQDFGGVAGADHRGQAELAADDGRMRGAAAVIGDDRRGALHDRHPIGIGGAGDQDRTVDEAADIARILDQADAAGDGRIADAQAGDQPPAFALDRIGSQRRHVAARLHRFRPRLHDEELAGVAVLGPLHVHRTSVMRLDGAGPARELENVGVLEHEAGSLRLRRRHVARRTVVAGRSVDHLLRLAAELLLDDRRERGVGEERLVDLVFVGIDRALHHVLAQPPGGVDQNQPVESGLGVDREHHPGGAAIRMHHALNADRERDLEMIEALGLPVADGTVGEQRGVAAPAGIEQRGLAADIQERFLLPGEARVRQVFRGRAGAHGDVEIILPAAAAQFAIAGADGLRQIVRPLPAQKLVAYRRADLGERGMAGTPRRERIPDHPHQSVGFDESPVSVRRRGEAVGNLDARAAERTDHFAERGVLAADARDIAALEVRKPGCQRVFFRHHALPRRWPRRFRFGRDARG